MAAAAPGGRPGPEDGLAEVLRALAADGYVDAFPVEGGRLRSAGSSELIELDNVVVDELHRFEGVSNPDDEAVVLALHQRGRSGDWRGVVVTGYGSSASEADTALLQLIDAPRPSR